MPLLVVAIVAAKSYSARFRVELTFGGLLLAVPVAAVAGYAFCRGFGVDHLPALLAMLAMGGAWIAREVLRWSS